MRVKNDARGVLGVMETCLRTNFAGVESPRCVMSSRTEFVSLNSRADCTARSVFVSAVHRLATLTHNPLQTFYGTKDLIEGTFSSTRKAMRSGTSLTLYPQPISASKRRLLNSFANLLISPMRRKSVSSRMPIPTSGHRLCAFLAVPRLAIVRSAIA